MLSDVGQAAHQVAIPVRFCDEGLEAARKLVLTAAGRDAAAVFALLASICQNDPGAACYDLAAFDALGWPNAGLQERLHDATHAFSRAFSMHLLKGLDWETAKAKRGDHHPRIEIAPALLTLFKQGPAAPPATTALLDADATTWAAVVAAAARSKGGHHLALRCAADDLRSVADFAAHVAATGVRVIYWHGDEPLRAALLAAELFGDNNTVVVADGSYLINASRAGEDTDAEAPLADANVLVIDPLAAVVASWFEGTRATYVWRITEHGALPPKLRRLIAASFGPLRQDAGWRAAHLKGLAPGIEAHGLRALLTQVDDARDAAPMARLAVAITEAGLMQASTVDAACALIANSQGDPGPAPTAEASQFDAALVACEPDGLRLLDRGDALAKGARILVHGAPGGGKSSYARVLATRIAEVNGAAPMVVEPAGLIARSWGATERHVAALWQKAHRAAAPLIADEFDSMAGVREADAPASGNAHLIRVLTNEWLRQMDVHPGVPLIVTVNDVEALDPAIRRRFAVAIEVRDELSAEQEMRAWSSIFGMAPPADWSPAGASVGDYASARDRCRLLGREDAEAHADALIEARKIRLGERKSTRRPAKRGRLN